ncbi:MAG: two-component sensor histidine kinase [Deltaproteobacteria bacterium]|nr:two-component sensor histidine kinase [Deltaproteobacteria bacterium]
MNLWRIIKPPFWDRGEAAPGTSHHQFDYRRIWKLAVILTGGVSLLPLIVITVVNYTAMQRAIESEFQLRAVRIVSNNRRAISFFLTERKAALDFIVHDNSLEDLKNPERLANILADLGRSFGGGFVDLGVIDASGHQVNYVGPYRLEGKDYSGQEWFEQVAEYGVHVSDVFLGFRKVPHMVIAVKGGTDVDSFYVLRAALSIRPFESLLSNLELSGEGDAFLINREGVLQTPSRHYGDVLGELPLPLPKYTPQTQLMEERNAAGEELLIGYRYIEEGPFILMVVKKKKELMKPWDRVRLELIVFLLVSATVILTVILGMSTYMVRRIQVADEKRVATLHQVEYANKMASIGRLAASVAHEINNPLAVINEKAGLLQDLFKLKKQYEHDERLLGLVDSVVASVDRAGTITKRLLNFARNLEAEVEEVRIEEVIEQVLGFIGKEAELRDIDIRLEVPEDFPPFECDRGKLQQIFLNIINNAFAAVEDGGHLNIRVEKKKPDFVVAIFEDDGCGIPEEDLARIFEPFYSTKTGQGGTGLGLSITYGLVQEIGGHIQVKSQVGKGTRFKVYIPTRAVGKEERV